MCIFIGVGLGSVFPSQFMKIGDAEVAQVNIPVAILVWLMIVPMLMKIDIKAMHKVLEQWQGIGVTAFVNWAIKPFSWHYWEYFLLGTYFTTGFRLIKLIPILLVSLFLQLRPALPWFLCGAIAGDPSFTSYASSYQ